MSVGTWLRRKAKSGEQERTEPSVWSDETAPGTGDAPREPDFPHGEAEREVSPGAEDFWFDEAELRSDPEIRAEATPPANGRSEPHFLSEADYQPVVADWADEADGENWSEDDGEWVEEDEPRSRRGRVLAAAILLIGVTAGGAYAVMTMSGDEEPVAAAIEETEDTVAAADEAEEEPAAASSESAPQEPLPGAARHAFESPGEDAPETAQADAPVRIITPDDDISRQSETGGQTQPGLTTGSVEGEPATAAPTETAEIEADPFANSSGVEEELAGGPETGTQTANAPFIVPPPLEESAAADDPWAAMNGQGETTGSTDAFADGMTGGGAGAARVTSYVNMRAGPDNNAEVISVLSEGAAVEVLGCEGWCQVNAGGQLGYVYESFLDRSGGGQQTGSAM